MKRKFLFAVMIFILSNGCYPSKNIYSKAIKLQQKCFYENRNVTNSIKDAEAELTVQNNFYVLKVKDRKYIPCNLPAGIKHQSIIISGEILQIMPNERLMGTPLRLSSAYIK